MEGKVVLTWIIFLYNSHPFSEMLVYSSTHKLSAPYNASLRPSTLFQSSYNLLRGSLGVSYLCGMQRKAQKQVCVSTIKTAHTILFLQVSL